MKTLVIFHLWHGPGHFDMSDESNVWYAKYYEAHFGRVYVVSLIGKKKLEGTAGKTTFLSLGTGSNKIDVILSPWRLYKFAKQVSATALLTYEQVWLWWLKIFIRVFYNRKIYLMPITIPESIYSATGKSLSRNIPIGIEEKMIDGSYVSCDYAVTSKGYGNYIDWLQREKIFENKLIIVDKLPEALPTPYFFDQIKAIKKSAADDKIKLLYVGRLNKEKLVDDLIKMLAILNADTKKYTLTLIGDGDEKEHLVQLSKKMKVDGDVQFLGYVSNGQLPHHYTNADVFVSPLTGSSLREAALCGVPIVAYKMDWLTTVLQHEKHYLGVAPHDYRDLAAQVQRLTDDPKLKRQISENVKTLAWQLWSPDELEKSLQKVFASATE